MIKPDDQQKAALARLLHEPDFHVVLELFAQRRQDLLELCAENDNERQTDILKGRAREVRELLKLCNPKG